jgi:hypothetical protein
LVANRIHRGRGLKDTAERIGIIEGYRGSGVLAQIGEKVPNCGNGAGTIGLMKTMADFKRSAAVGVGLAVVGSSAGSWYLEV